MSEGARFNLKLNDIMSRHSAPGLRIAIVRDGQLEWSESLGVLEAGTEQLITNNTLFHACSISKMVTAIGVLRLVQEGVLDLEEDVNRYLVSWQVPDNEYTAHRKVTLRSLLSHYSGIVDPEGSFDVYQEQDPFPTPAQLLLGLTRYNSVPMQVTSEPGSQFSYSDAGYTLIEQIVEDVTEESFAAVIERLVLVPLGLKHTLFWEGSFSEDRVAVVGHDQYGHIVRGKRAQYPNRSGAGIWTTPSELALLIINVIKAWNGDTTCILQSHVARAMVGGYGGVGFGIFLSQDGDEPYFISQGWGVGAQCKLVAYPRLKCGVVVMTNSDPGKHQDEALVGEVIREICKEALGKD